MLAPDELPLHQASGINFDLDNNGGPGADALLAEQAYNSLGRIQLAAPT